MDGFFVSYYCSMKLKLAIWSDVMCPFCYIGKRKLEEALASNEFNDLDVEIEWKSFQLSPNMITDPSKSLNQYLAEHKGISIQEAEKMNAYVSGVAAEVGLNFQLNKAIPANSLDAHRLSHLAKRHNKQHALEEALFSAYFTKGLNTADHEVLTQLGEEIGLPSDEISEVLNSAKFTSNVHSDIEEASRIGVRGVPFFVFNNKYAISGAQPVDAFKETIQQLITEMKTED